MTSRMNKQNPLQKWYVLTLLIVASAVVALSISISLQTEKSFRDFRSSVDTLGLKQAENAFSLLDITAKDITRKVYSHGATTLLSLAPSIDSVTPEFIKSYQRMQDMALPFIHSINVIHVPSGELITSNRGWFRVNDDIIQDIETAYPELPNLTPLPIRSNVSYGDSEELVFAYILRDRFEDEVGLVRGVILLVESSWFLDAMSQSDDPRTGTRFLLYHPRLGILGDAAKEPCMNSITEELNRLTSGNATSDTFESEWEDTLYHGEYTVLGKSKLYLVRLRNQSVLRAEVRFLRLKVAGLVMIFLILITITGFVVNKRIYEPFYSVVTDIRESIGDRIQLPESDLDLLSSMYANLRDEYSGNGENRVITNCLRSLTLEENDKPNESIEILRKRSIVISPDHPGSLFLISLDHFDEDFDERETSSSLSYASMKFQLREAVSEAFGNLNLDFSAFFTKRGQLLALAFPDSESDTGVQLHKMINTLLNLPVSIVDCRDIRDFIELKERYIIMISKLRRRYLLGRGVYISVSDSEVFPAEDERKRIRNLRNIVINAIAEQKTMPQEIGSYIKSIRIWAIESALDEINAFSLSLVRTLANQDESFQSQSLFKSLINQPSIDDFRNIVEEFSNEQKGAFFQTESRHAAVVTAARDILEHRYPEPGLSMQSVAEDIGMSSTYFGMIFKRSIGSSFSDYLTMVRIQEAARLLVETRMPVLEIMTSVGILSESTFYRRFREYYHITPQSYRLQMATRHTTE